MSEQAASSTETQTTTASVVTKSIHSMARESIVLLTVIIVLVACGVAWTQVVNPFMKSQSEITAKTAETLLAIKDLSEAVARTAEAQRAHADAITKMVERLERADRSGVR